MKVLVLYTLAPEVIREGHRAGEYALKDAADEIARSLPDAETAGTHGSASEILTLLQNRRPDVVFNLCEAPLGRPELESHVAALFEWQGVRFTGSSSETLALCRRKDRTKAVLAAADVPVPRACVFPCIVKPADEDGSSGIHSDSVCANQDSLLKAQMRLAGPVIVEEFLPGREFVIALWGQTEPDHVSIGEAFFENGLQIFTYAAKWDIGSPDFENSLLDYCTDIESSLRAALTATARATWRAVGARGYLRLDIRLDESGIPRVLDVNPNPEVAPGAGMHRAVTESGWSWERFVRQQVEWV